MRDSLGSSQRPAQERPSTQPPRTPRDTDRLGPEMAHAVLSLQPVPQRRSLPRTTTRPRSAWLFPRTHDAFQTPERRCLVTCLPRCLCKARPDPTARQRRLAQSLYIHPPIVNGREAREAKREAPRHRQGPATGEWRPRRKGRDGTLRTDPVERAALHAPRLLVHKPHLPSIDSAQAPSDPPSAHCQPVAYPC